MRTWQMNVLADSMPPDPRGYCPRLNARELLRWAWVRSYPRNLRLSASASTEAGAIPCSPPMTLATSPKLSRAIVASNPAGSLLLHRVL